MKIELHVHGFEVKFKAELAGELMLRTQSNNLHVIPSSPPSRRSELGCGSSEHTSSYQTSVVSTPSVAALGAVWLPKPRFNNVQ